MHTSPGAFCAHPCVLVLFDTFSYDGGRVSTYVTTFEESRHFYLRDSPPESVDDSCLALTREPSLVDSLTSPLSQALLIVHRAPVRLCMSSTPSPRPKDTRSLFSETPTRTCRTLLRSENSFGHFDPKFSFTHSLPDAHDSSL